MEGSKTMTIRKFYKLSNDDHYAFARRTENVSPLVIPQKCKVSNWRPPLFLVKKSDGIIADYIFSGVGGRFCSDKLKKVIEENKLEIEIIEWLPVDIFIEETKETIRYHHLHFLKPADCLNLEYCKFIDKELAAPFYSYKKIKRRNIFNCPEGYETIITIVSQDMLEALEQAEITGLSFEPANVIYDEEKTRQATS